MAKDRMSIDDVLGDVEVPVVSFEEADRRESVDKTVEGVNKGGRPIKGRSKATNKVAFHIDDETLAWLEGMTNTKERTPNAVIKKILTNQYELMNKN